MPRAGEGWLSLEKEEGICGMLLLLLGPPQPSCPSGCAELYAAVRSMDWRERSWLRMRLAEPAGVASVAHSRPSLRPEEWSKRLLNRPGTWLRATPNGCRRAVKRLP